MAEDLLNSSAEATEAGGAGDQVADNEIVETKDQPTADNDSKAAEDSGKQEANEDISKDADAKDGSKDDQAAGQSDGQDDGDADKPIADWSKVDIKFPEGFDVNKDSLESFGEAAVKSGLTQKQAQALIDWQIGEIKAHQQAMLEVGKEDLQKVWGKDYEKNRKAAIGVVQRIDRMLGENNEFSKALNISGAGLYPAILKGLHKLSEVISEDSMGHGGGAGGANKPETAYEGIINALNEQRRKVGNV